MAIAGIDLGTTNSLIALWTDSGRELVANALGDTLTPSAVSIAEDGAVLVGRAAADRLITHPVARSPRSSAGWALPPARGSPAASIAPKNCRRWCCAR